jgi:sodium-dependent dicarboxylate transporter 2/3/5
MKDVHTLLLVFEVCCLVTIISEFAFNVASIQLMLPILFPLVEALRVHPLILMISATLAALLGFILPIATEPKTIVFRSERTKVTDVMCAEIIMNIIGIIITTTVML